MQQTPTQDAGCYTAGKILNLLENCVLLCMCLGVCSFKCYSIPKELEHLTLPQGHFNRAGLANMEGLNID